MGDGEKILEKENFANNSKIKFFTIFLNRLWAESVLMEDAIQDEDTDNVRDILAKLGLADVKPFGLSWEDCNEIMSRLGYVLRIDAGLVA